MSILTLVAEDLIQEVPVKTLRYQSLDINLKIFLELRGFSIRPLSNLGIGPLLLVRRSTLDNFDHCSVAFI